MDVLYERCAGLDVHQQTIVACRISPGPEGRARKEVQTFSATTAGLQLLADWLTEAGCKHVAMESTGVYWKPVYNLLEGRFTVIVANATAIKRMPGRKPMYPTASGSRTCCSTDSSAPALFQTGPNANSET